MAAQRQSEKVPKNISPQNSFPKLCTVFFPLLTPPHYPICTRGGSVNGKKENHTRQLMCFKKDPG